MYCVNCGVKLADSQKSCPLCATVCYHPDLPRPHGEALYPRQQYPIPKVRPQGVMLLLTVLFAIPILVMLVCDMQIGGGITWAGFASGAVALCYIAGILPWWFQKPNPVIFVPCGFAAAAVYLLYVNLATGGSWFLTFAFPVTGSVCLIVTTLVTLLRYVRKGRLFTIGGCILALAALMLLIEFLMYVTFDYAVTGWALYPGVTLFLLGAYLIFLGTCRPAREMMARKFFF